MAKGTHTKNPVKMKMGVAKSVVKKPIIDDTEEESVKPKIIEVDTDDTEKIVDPELETDPLAADAEEEEDEATLDEDEIDPFGDKWEQ